MQFFFQKQNPTGGSLTQEKKQSFALTLKALE